MPPLLHGSRQPFQGVWVQALTRGVRAVGAGEERLMQVLRHMNQLLDRHPQSRRRGLTFNALTIVPVWPQARALLHRTWWAA